MCGIFAHIKTEPLTEADVKQAELALSVINHRGPDGDGMILLNSATGDFTFFRTPKTPESIPASGLSTITLSKYNIILGHKRLSIFDLSSNGFQPMVDTTTGNVIIFNGEIYNWREIKTELLALGHHFKSQTDTEVILAAYKEWGVDCFNHFNGMWAIVLFDKQRQQVLASRDRFSVKPLNYALNSKEIIYASEIKQLAHYAHLTGGFNTGIIQYFLNEGLVAFDEHTIYNNVFSFPQSHYAYILPVNIQQKCIPYYTLKPQARSIDFKSAVQEFKFLLNDAIRLRLRADVPVGVALSGGIDSSSIFVLAHQQLQESGQSKNLNTFSIVSPGHSEDESEHINALIKEYKSINHFDNPSLRFSVNDLKNHLFYHDFPAPSPSFYADFCLSRLVRKQNVTVILNGQGADEVFAGYHHHFYKYIASLYKDLKFKLYREQLNAFLEVKNISKQKVDAAVKSELKQYLKSIFGIKIKDTYHTKDKWLYSKNLTEMMMVDLQSTAIPFYLTSNDRNTMAFGLESRHPFMDYRLIEFGFSLPDHFKIDNGFQKLIIREAMNELPDSIRWRKDKMGFTVPETVFMSTLQEDKTILKKELEQLGIPFQETFRHYSIAIILEHFNKTNAFRV